MKNLHITAHLSTPISIQGWLPLDSLLIAQEAARLQLPPVEVGGVQEIPIPIKRHERGFYYTSFGRGVVTPKTADQTWRRRRFGIREGAALGNDSIKKVPVNMGPLKSINLPTYTLDVPILEWWCVGDEGWVREALGNVLGLGKMRGHGFGAVDQWDVAPCDEDWSLFYPSERPGVARPARVLPADLPELKGKIVDLQYAVLCPPYWQTERAELCAVPEAIHG